MIRGNRNNKITKSNCIVIKNATDAGVSKLWIASQIGVHLSTVYRATKKADALIAELNRSNA